MNSLNLYFGTRLPTEFENVGLAFISSPILRSDSAIGVLSAARYAQPNYDHLENQLNMFSFGSSQSKIQINYSSPNLSILGSTASGAFSANAEVTLYDEDWGPQIINSSIKIAGIQITPAGTWCPTVMPGVVWRTGYILAASGIETSGSWLRRAIDPNNTKDKSLVLIYSIPEVLYATKYSSSYGPAFPPSQAKYKQTKEIVTPINPNTLSYEGNVSILQKVVVNGTTRFEGTFSEVSSSSSIRELNKELKQIALYTSVNPDDTVEITYLSYNDYYVYSGFRDYYNRWWPFDANPEYGHVIGNDETLLLDHSSDALIKQVTLYAIPSAALHYEFVENQDTSEVLGTLTIKAYRAIDYGETHVVRHLISSEPVEQIDSRSGASVINTWGHAVLGRNFYDEQNQYGGDIFSSRVPSMLPLGRFVLAAPASVRSVSIADIRQRGGGVPLDFPMSAVDSQQNGLDTLRGFLDLSNWEGKAVKEGGVVEVQISSSLLKTDPDDTDPTTFLASEIYDIVKSQVPPGIDFVIRYLDI